MTAQPGDTVYIGHFLANIGLWGWIQDPDTPPMITGSFDVVENQGALVTSALIGPQGDPGEPSPIVKLQYTSTISDPLDLPDNLTTDPVDIGKAWWIGNQVYTWSGTGWLVRPMGTQGPPGPTPIIHPTVELLDPDNPALVSTVEKSGTPEAPNLHFKLKAPRGPKGDNARILEAADYSNTFPPTAGQVIAWNATKNKFEAVDPDPVAARLYSVPEAMFTNYQGATTRQQIASFAVPAQPFDWIPYVTGHIRANGVELDADPLIIGCEVRLGHPTTGTLVARGFGNNSTWTTIVPHFSTPTTPSDAVTPDGALARVPGSHTGTAGTLYLSLYNDGPIGVYNFDKKNAQISVLVVPV